MIINNNAKINTIKVDMPIEYKEKIEKIPELEEQLANKSEINHTHDYSSISNTPSIPTKVGDLTNDQNYASKAYVSSFTYSINLELKQYNVYAIAFNLPRMDTDFDLHAKRKSKLKKGKNPMVIADKIYKKMNSKKGIMNIGLSTKLMNLFSHLLPKSLISKCIGSKLR